MKRIAVVIVTYNAEKWVPFCFNSLLNNTISADVIAVDNASGDNTVSMLRANFPQVDLVPLKTNLGFGRANNIGIIKAYNKGYDFIFLLNQDAAFRPDTVETLVNIHEKSPEYGIISPIHLADDGKVVDKGFLAYLTQSGYGKFISDVISGQPIQSLYDFPFINAAIWCISRKCIETVGVFDDIFFHYGEDSDYCKRVWQKNLKIGIAPSAKALHNRSQLPGRKTISVKERLHLRYIIFLKQPDKSLLKLYFIHSYKSIKFAILSLLRFDIKMVSGIVSANFKLLSYMDRIKKSRREQLLPFAYMKNDYSSFQK